MFCFTQINIVFLLLVLRSIYKSRMGHQKKKEKRESITPSHIIQQKADRKKYWIRAVTALQPIYTQFIYQSVRINSIRKYSSTFYIGIAMVI